MNAGVHHRSSATSLAEATVNIDGIPRRVGDKWSFTRSLLINIFFGFFTFCCTYNYDQSVASRMGSISGLGGFLILLGFVLLLLHFFEQYQLSIYIGGLLLVSLGVYFMANALIKYLMASRFAVAFNQEWTTLSTQPETLIRHPFHPSLHRTQSISDNISICFPIGLHSRYV